MLRRTDTVSPLAPQRSFAISVPLVLPPGFQARHSGADPWADALEAAPADQPGTVFWSAAAGLCRAAILLAPDRPLAEGVVVELGLLATLDALAVLAPPHVPLAVARPATILVDGGAAATVRAAHGPERDSEGFPTWAIFGLNVAVSPLCASPGDTPDQTSLQEEGFGEVTAAEVLQHACRYLLGWIDVWREEGDGALARALAHHVSHCGVMHRAVA